MVELWKVRPGASLLDIGCGNGEVTVMVSQKVRAGESFPETDPRLLEGAAQLMGGLR